MGKHVLGRLALATMPALIMLTAMTASPAAAVTEIDTCQVLDTFGATYRVTQDLSSCDTDCLVVANDRITIDLQGHQISADCITLVGAGITDAGIARDGIAVKNGTVAFYFFGINLGSSSRTTVRNVTASDNFVGIQVGSQSLVKDCHAHRNVFFGIGGGDRVQVQGCNVSDNFFGIGAGAQCLITRNHASKNALGIEAGERCTVSHNVANENGAGVEGIGILVAPNSLVTSNEANNNTAIGISVACPSTVANNTATGNDGFGNYVFQGDGCHTNNNKE